MKRKLSILILAGYVATLEFIKWIPKGFIQLLQWLRLSAKNFPELITLPICILALLTYPYLLEESGINWLFEQFHADPDNPDRSIKAFQVMLLALIYVFLANAAAYAAIKYNRRDLWEFYTKQYAADPLIKIKNGAKELCFYWACYFFGILAAIFLAHSLILV